MIKSLSPEDTQLLCQEFNECIQGTCDASGVVSWINSQFRTDFDNLEDVWEFVNDNGTIDHFECMCCGWYFEDGDQCESGFGGEEICSSCYEEEQGEDE